MKVCRFLVAGLNTKQNRMLLHLQRWRAVRKVGVCLFVCAASMEAIFSIAVHHFLAKCSSFCIMSVSLASINCAKKAGIDLLIIISLRVAGSHVSSPKSQVTGGQFVQSLSLRKWKLGFIIPYMVPSFKFHVWHEWLHDNIFWRWGLGLVLRVGSSQEANPNFW